MNHKNDNRGTDKGHPHISADTEIPTHEQIVEAERCGFQCQVKTAKIRFDELFPGVLASITVAAAATFLSDHYNAPTMLFALLIGMAFRFLSEDEGKALIGIQFASTTILRIGVALLGMRITIDQLQSLGIKPLTIVIGSVFLTILFGVVLSKFLGRGKRFGILTGGSVGICGASAALAIAAILPKDEYSERNTIFTVISVTAMSTLAMIIYPVVAKQFGLDLQATGIFLGGTIHDVAQVVGAGYSVSEKTGDTATVIKLLRVSLLVPIVFSLSLIFHTHTDEAGKKTKKMLLPPFIIFFVLFVGINSMHVIPASINKLFNELSRWCLVTAIGALGMKTSLKSLFEVGWKPVSIMLAETVFLAALVLGSLYFLT
ncbi:MAG: YeiH family putative sulfate export transporter [Chlorobiaceae bacterium]|jgi:uncharacterized integral membrane protein (TIGR00698 family)|nr:YeiH family putative sulfate export transporter [Chlorobiaceae bacterium]